MKNYDHIQGVNHTMWKLPYTKYLVIIITTTGRQQYTSVYLPSLSMVWKVGEYQSTVTGMVRYHCLPQHYEHIIWKKNVFECR